MDIFGDHWTDHGRRICEAWDRVVTDEDLVLVPGDISWAMKLKDAIPDLEDLNARPGVKLFTKGNHDLWWPRKKRQFTLEGLPSLFFAHGRTLRMGKLGMAVIRGWTIPGDSWYTAQDQKVYEKELRYLDETLPLLGDAEIRMVVMHYPPFNNRKQAGGFVERFKAHGIQHVVHGHLHGKGCDQATITGLHEGIHYHLTSCDHIGFEPVEILSDPTLSLQPVALLEGKIRHVDPGIPLVGSQVPRDEIPPPFPLQTPAE